MVDYMDMTIPFLELPVPDKDDTNAVYAYNRRFGEEYKENLESEEPLDNNEEYKECVKRVESLFEARLEKHWDELKSGKRRPIEELPEEHDYDKYACYFDEEE